MATHAQLTALDVAVCPQEWLGIDAQMWLRMQAAYDLWQAERNKQRPHIQRLHISLTHV